MTAAQMRAEAQGFLARNWRLIAATTAAMLLVGALYAMLAPAKYKSSAELLVDPRGLQILKNEITRSGDSTDGNLVDIENQRYILLSRSVLQAVVDQQKLAESPLFGGAPPGLLSRLAGAIGVVRKPIDRRARAIQALTDMVEVVRGERAYVLDVIVTSGDADLSAQLANVIAKTYLQEQNDAKSEVAKRASDELTRRAEDLRKQVQLAEEKVERYRAAHDLVQTPSGRMLGEQQINDLSTQTGLVRARIADAQARVDAVERARKSGLSVEALTEALSSPTMTSLRSQYAQAAQQEASLATQLGPRHPALVQAQEQVRDVRRQISAELDRIASAAKTDLARAKDAEASLQKQSGAVRASSDQSAAALVELHDLERAAEANRTVYQAFLGRAKELGESQGIDSTNARIISPAIPAGKPAGAPPLLILAGSLLFGLTLGGGLAYARDRLDDRIHSRQQLADETGLPILAAFSTTVEPNDAGAALVRLTPDRAAFRDLLARVGVHARADQTSIALVARHGASLPSQLVVGLAEFARWENLDVAIVDCAQDDDDRLARVFDEDETGAPTVRRRGGVRTMPISDLTRGGSLRRFRTRIDRLAAEVDVILFDAPSPVDRGDVRAVLEVVDAIVPVFQKDDLDRNFVDATMDALADYDDRVAGLVIIGASDQA
ncbi:MAG: GumC family protein [Hyphomicrobiales bacterium]|nr:GumC family protein [Hyphomicrobiales bacterium]